jgi:uncharacterized protein HemX
MSERALTVLAFTDSGWMRRFRVPQRAATALAALLVGLSLTAPLVTAFAIRARAELSRLRAVERENHALTSQLQNQATLLHRLQSEMARLRELERRLRAASGLADLHGTAAGTGQGENLCRGQEVRKC